MRSHYLAEAADCIDDILELAGVVVTKADPNPLEEEGYEELVQRLRRSLFRGMQEDEIAVMKDYLAALQVDWVVLSAAAVEAALIEAAAELAALDALAPVMGALVADDFENMILSTRKALQSTYGDAIIGTTTRVDTVAIEHAATSQAHFFRNEVGKRQISYSETGRKIVSRGIADGLDSATIGKDLAAELGAKQLKRSVAYYQNVASIHMSRARSFGQLTGYQQAGFREVEFVASLDEVTTNQCFDGATLISTPSGERPITALRTGDDVLVGSGGVRRILDIRSRPAREWMALTLSSGGTITVTKEHPFMTESGWTKALNIIEGRSLVARSGDRQAQVDRRGERDPAEYLRRNPGRAVVLKVEHHVGDLEVFNIEVDDDPTYYAAGVLVHNCRFNHGRRFSVAGSLQKFQQVAAADDPEAVVEIQPFMQTGRDDDGEFLYYKSGGERVQVARIEESAVGLVDAVGKYSSALSNQQLESAGLATPPLHGFCRSRLLPA